MLKGVTKTDQNEVKEQKGGFLSMLLGTLGASLLGNLLTCRVFYFIYLIRYLQSIKEE